MNISRRNILKCTAVGTAATAFNGINIFGAEGKNVQQPHHAPKAKRIIFLNMRGAPSHMDTFDYKPHLAKNDGKNDKYGNELKGPVKPFHQSGRSGLWISDLFPNIQKCADDLCLLRGMYTSQSNHPPAQTVMHTGNFQFARPSLGSWLI